MSDMKIGSYVDPHSGVLGFGKKTKEVTAKNGELDQVGIAIVADRLGVKAERDDGGRLLFKSKDDALKVIRAQAPEMGKHDYGIFENADGTFSIAELNQDIQPSDISSFKQDAKSGTATKLVSIFTDEDSKEHAVAPPPPPPAANPNAGNSVLERMVGASKDLNQ